MCKLMFVYRVEVRDVKDKGHSNIGAGVYCGQLPDYAPKCVLSRILDANMRLDGIDVQPLPDEDKGLKPYLDSSKWGGNYEAIRFAFESLESYKSWFHNALGRLEAAQWGIISRYEVPVSDVLVGTSQCLVVARSMKRVGYHELN